jgi:hypothetical protein
MDIDWSKAPEGFDGHGFVGLKDRAVWFNRDGYTYVDGQQCATVFAFGGASSYAVSELHNITKLPAPAWNGTGLPPVGTVCEMHHECWQPANWPEVTVKYASDEYFITQDSAGEQHWHAHGVQFRPIRTPEQIAADEREAAIDEIMDDLSLSPECRYIARRVLNTGYRKP